MKVARPPLALFVVAMALAAPAAITRAAEFVTSENHWRGIGARGTLRVGIDPNWQPFSFYDASGWNGFDADLSREVARRLGLQLANDPVGYDSLFDALAQARVDVVVSAITPDSARGSGFAFSDAYFDAGVMMAPSRATSPSDAMRELERKRVAVAFGTRADQVARYWERRAEGMTRVPMSDDAAALVALRAGEADIILFNALDAPLPWPPESVSIEPKPYVLAVQGNSARLLREINRTLGEMERDGAMTALRKKWKLAAPVR